MSITPVNLSISVAEKPTKHISTADWQGKVQNLKTYGDDERDKTSILRNETRQTRHEATIRSLWSQHNNNVHLGDR